MVIKGFDDEVGNARTVQTEYLFKFGDHWTLYDPHATCLMNHKHFKHFVATVFSPLGFGGRQVDDSILEAQVERLRKKMPETRKGHYHFKDVLCILSANLISEKHDNDERLKEFVREEAIAKMSGKNSFRESSSNLSTIMMRENSMRSNRSGASNISKQGASPSPSPITIDQSSQPVVPKERLAEGAKVIPTQTVPKQGRSQLKKSKDSKDSGFSAKLLAADGPKAEKGKKQIGKERGRGDSPMLHTNNNINNSSSINNDRSPDSSLLSKLEDGAFSDSTPTFTTVFTPPLFSKPKLLQGSGVNSQDWLEFRTQMAIGRGKSPTMYNNINNSSSNNNNNNNNNSNNNGDDV